MGLAKIATWLRRPSLYKARHFRRREEMRADYQRVAESLLEHLESGAPIACDEENPQAGNQRPELQSERDAILARHLDVGDQ